MFAIETPLEREAGCIEKRAVVNEENTRNCKVPEGSSTVQFSGLLVQTDMCGYVGSCASRFR
jgi:hypothetical protein